MTVNRALVRSRLTRHLASSASAPPVIPAPDCDSWTGAAPGAENVFQFEAFNSVPAGVTGVRWHVVDQDHSSPDGDGQKDFSEGLPFLTGVASSVGFDVTIWWTIDREDVSAASPVCGFTI